MAKLLDKVMTWVCKNSATDIYNKSAFSRGILKPIGDIAAQIGRIIPGGKNVHKDLDPYPELHATKAELVDRKKLPLSQKRIFSRDKTFKRGHIYLMTGCMIDPKNSDRLIEREIFVTAAQLQKKVGITELPRDSMPIGDGKSVIAKTNKVDVGATSQFWGPLRVMAQKIESSPAETDTTMKIAYTLQNHPERVDRKPIANFTSNTLTP